MQVDSKTWVFLNKCSVKKHYKTKRQAKEAAARCLKDYGVKMAPYHCQACGSWHLSKQRFKEE